jgi:hypothetical protein
MTPVRLRRTNRSAGRLTAPVHRDGCAPADRGFAVRTGCRGSLTGCYARSRFVAKHPGKARRGLEARPGNRHGHRATASPFPQPTSVFIAAPPFPPWGRALENKARPSRIGDGRVRARGATPIRQAGQTKRPSAMRRAGQPHSCRARSLALTKDDALCLDNGGNSGGSYSPSRGASTSLSPSLRSGFRLAAQRSIPRRRSGGVPTSPRSLDRRFDVYSPSSQPVLGFRLSK